MAGSVTTTYLELVSSDTVRPPSAPEPPGFATRVVHDPSVHADMYRRVGADYAWIDRLRWSDEQWTRHADRVETHLVEVAGGIAGYFEIETQADSAKIGIFGLLGEFHGRGLGGHALVAALERGLELSPRVWLTTCTLDGPHALANYTARGMRPFRTETAPLPPGVTAS